MVKVSFKSRDKGEEKFDDDVDNEEEKGDDDKEEQRWTVTTIWIQKRVNLSINFD